MLFPGDVSHRGRHAGEYDPRTIPGRKVLFGLVLLLVLLLLSWPFIEPHLLETEQRTIYADDLPAAIGQLRVIYLSDLHVGTSLSTSGATELVSRINDMNADLVLLGGDYALDSTGAIALFKSLPRLHARYGVFAVMGNHDRTVPEGNLIQLRAAMKQAGVTPLVNEVVPIRIGTGTIHIAGVDDVNNGHPDLNSITAQVRSDDYVIFLCHSPAIIPEAMAAAERTGDTRWFDLGLFGHTHGGQVALLGAGRDPSVDARYFSGWVHQNGCALLTSRGVGTSGLPVRLLCRPQIHDITIRAQD